MVNVVLVGTLVHKVNQDRPERRAPLETEVSPVLMGYQVKRVHKVKEEDQAHQEQKVYLEMLDVAVRPDLLALGVWLVLWVHREPTENKDHWGLQEMMENQDQPDPLEVEGEPDPWAYPDPKAWQEMEEKLGKLAHLEHLGKGA